MSVSLDDPADGIAVAEATSVGVAEASVAANDNAPAGQQKNYISFGDYRMDHRGLFFTGKDDPEHISGPFEVVAATTDGRGEAWGLLLRWHDRLGRCHQWAVSQSMLAGTITDVKKYLLHRGLPIYLGGRVADWFGNYLLRVKPPAFARCVSKTGWDGKVYVTADRVIGSTENELVVYQPDRVQTLHWQELGDQIRWQNEVARYAIGNSRLAFAISAAFAGPLLHLAGEDSRGFHFAGGSSSGKTTALRCSASVYGVPLRTWRTTDNGAEAVAAEANDAALYLDELSQVDGKAADAMAYMLGNGTGKVRAGQHGQARQTATWRTILLSTGEIGLAEKLGETGKKPKAGQSVRLVEIPADAGAGHKLFEHLHGFEDGHALATHLRHAVENHHGTAIISFLEALVVRLAEIPGIVREGQKDWIEANLPAGSDGQVQRVAASFALVAAAGEIASYLGVLPWPGGESNRAAATCFGAWLAKRGGTGALEAEQAIDQVKAFIEAHGMSRFSPEANPDDPKTFNRVGWRRKDATGNWEYLIMPKAFSRKSAKA